MTAIITTTKFGPMLVPPYDFYLSQAMIRNGEYCPAEFETWRPYIPEGGTVVDVGANIGCHTLPFANAVGPTGTVIAIEPQLGLYHMLCGTVALNGLSQVVDVVHTALGREPGALNVPRFRYDEEANFGALELNDANDGDPVQVARLESISLNRLDFLKIDVEGMELDVLEGGECCIEAFRPVISAEADRPNAAEPMIAWLRAHDYRVWWHRPRLGELWPNIASHNLLAIPCSNALHPTGDVRLIA